MPDIYLTLLVLIQGLALGSFLNVVIARLPVMLESEMREEAEQFLGKKSKSRTVFNLARPASHCPHCKHAIYWWQNIPVLSYLFLKGQCYFCKQGISLRYPLIELFTGGLCVFLLWHFQLTFGFAAAILFFSLSILIFFIDWDHHYLPDIFSYLLLWSGLLCNLQGYFIPLTHAVLGAGIGYICFWMVYWVFKWITKKEGLGYGDFKLLAALGAWLGVLKLPFIILLASGLTLLGLLLRSIFLKISLRQPIAYGPGLVIAGSLLFLFQEPIGFII